MDEPQGAPSSGAEQSLEDYRTSQEVPSDPATPAGDGEKQQQGGPQATPPGETPATPTGQQQETDPETEKSRTAKRIEQLLSERASWRTRAQMYEARLQQAEQTRTQPPQTPAGEALTEPDPTEFDLGTADGTRKYAQAVNAWQRQEAEKLVESRMRAIEQRFGQQLQGQQAASTWNQSVTRAKTAHGDFDQVALSPELPVSPQTAARIRSMDNGADLLYHLGKHPDLAARLYPLDGPALDRALGRVEAAIEAGTGTPPATSNAAPGAGQPATSPPPTTLQGGTHQSAKLSVDLPLDEYRRRVEAGADY